MILNNLVGHEFRFFFLTQEMAALLNKQNVPHQGVHKLSVYHSVLTYGEMASILKFQLAMALVLGVTMPDPLAEFPEGYDKAMLTEAFNTTSRETMVEFIKKATCFQTLRVGQTILMVVGEVENRVLPGWTCMEGRTFSAALLESVYQQVGYLESHTVPATQPGLGQFTLAEVFKLLNVENP